MTEAEISAIVEPQLRALHSWVDRKTLQGWTTELRAGAPAVTEGELLTAIRAVRDDPGRRPNAPITVDRVLAVLRATTSAADIGNPFVSDADCQWGCRDGVVVMCRLTAPSPDDQADWIVPCSCRAGRARIDVQPHFRGTMNVEELQRRGWALRRPAPNLDAESLGWLKTRSRAVGVVEAIREMRAARE